MRVFYLSSEQGCATSVYAAIAQLPSRFNCDSNSGNMNVTSESEHQQLIPTSPQSLLPYLVPYYAPFSFVFFEMIGVFAGPNWSEASMPDSAIDSSISLWKFSSALCVSILKTCGISAGELLEY